MSAPQTPTTASSSDTNKSNNVTWDKVICRFLRNVGLTQALAGFENDILVMNVECDKEVVPLALEQLQNDLIALKQNREISIESIDERKLHYTHGVNQSKVASPSQLTRSISKFIAENRARNNISNRNEFLRQRKAPVAPSEASSSTDEVLMDVDAPTCARTDAIPVNRDVQVKYDVAKNEGGPLRRTVKSELADAGVSQLSAEKKGKASTSLLGQGHEPTLQRHPGLSERFTNLEDHLVLKYVPGPPASLMDRIKFLEDHIIRLERDYPPWAALHFKQPNRGWPPPPRVTPLIVPTHLTSTVETRPEEISSQEVAIASIVPPTAAIVASASQPRAKGRMKGKSSLHRAVMQKLEVKKALAGED